MKKKLLAIFLCLLMVFAMGTPGIAVAEGTGETETATESVGAAVNFTNVAPFLDPVVGRPVRRLMSATLQNAKNGDSTKTDGIEMTKNVKKNDDGTYTVTLESYVTGTVTSTEKSVPCDIVLALDMSTSMESNFQNGGYRYTKVYKSDLDENETYYSDNGYRSYKWCSKCNSWTSGCYNFFGHNKGTKYAPKTSADDTSGTQFYKQEYVDEMSRLDALKTAATGFVDSVAEKEEANRIAVVGFHDSGVYLTGTNASNSLKDAKKDTSTIKNSISNIRERDLEAATDHDDGLKLARDIFNANQISSGEQRKRVVIMITDGEPEPLNSGDWSASTVKNAITYAHTLKKDQGASVYTISVMPGSNAENPTSAMDKYMDYLSSNYPDAEYTGESNITKGRWEDETTYENRIVSQITPSNKDQSTGSFYLTAGDTDALNTIFEKIASQTGSASVELDAQAKVTDIISNSFTLPEGATKEDITVKTADADYTNGVLSWTNEKKLDSAVISIDVPQDGNEPQNVTVSGFDFAKNFVADKGRDENDATQPGNFYGRKLIVSFKIKAKPGFLGGNAVPTNDPEKSGVYDKDGKLVENFVADPETQDVEIKDITFDVSTNYTFLGAYAGNTVTQGDMKFNTKVKCNGVEIDLSKENDNYGLDPWQTAYVDISTELTDANGNKIPDSGLSGLYADTTFTMKVTVSPKTTGSATEQSHSETRPIKVFLPHVTFRDSEIALGTTAPKYDTNNWVETVWKLTDGTTEQEVRDQNGHIVNNGVAPTLTFTYNPTEGAFTTDTPVKVTVTMPTTGDATEDVTRYVTFHHKDCTFANCKWDDYKDTHQFIVHVKSFDLTITKTVDAVEPNQTFLFHIRKDGADYMDVTVQVGAEKTGSVTIKGLPVGSYTVTEDAAWSWRYALQGDNDRAVDLNSGVDGVVTVEFKNKLTTHTWLSGETSCENRWSGNRILKNGQPLSK